MYLHTRKRESCLHKTSEKQIKFGLSFSFLFLPFLTPSFSSATQIFLAITWRGKGFWVVSGKGGGGFCEGCTKSTICISWAWHCWGVVALITSVKMNFDYAMKARTRVRWQCFRCFLPGLIVSRGQAPPGMLWFLIPILLAGAGLIRSG